MKSSRKSKKREAIYAALCASDEHPTAENLYIALKPEIPDLSLGTVYRNLSLFKQEGLAVSVTTVNGQERFDACTIPHAHFICRHCGRVLDMGEVPLLPSPDPAVLVEGVKVHYHGLCADCQGERERDVI